MIPLKKLIETYYNAQPLNENIVATSDSLMLNPVEITALAYRFVHDNEQRYYCASNLQLQCDEELMLAFPNNIKNLLANIFLLMHACADTSKNNPHSAHLLSRYQNTLFYLINTLFEAFWEGNILQSSHIAKQVFDMYLIYLYSAPSADGEGFEDKQAYVNNSKLIDWIKINPDLIQSFSNLIARLHPTCIPWEMLFRCLPKSNASQIERFYSLISLKREGNPEEDIPMYEAYAQYVNFLSFRQQLHWLFLCLTNKNDETHYTTSQLKFHGDFLHHNREYLHRIAAKYVLYVGRTPWPLPSLSAEIPNAELLNIINATNTEKLNEKQKSFAQSRINKLWVLQKVNQIANLEDRAMYLQRATTEKNILCQFLQVKRSLTPNILRRSLIQEAQEQYERVKKLLPIVLAIKKTEPSLDVIIRNNLINPSLAKIGRNKEDIRDHILAIENLTERKVLLEEALDEKTNSPLHQFFAMPRGLTPTKKNKGVLFSLQQELDKIKIITDLEALCLYSSNADFGLLEFRLSTLLKSKTSPPNLSGFIENCSQIMQAKKCLYSGDPENALNFLLNEPIIHSDLQNIMNEMLCEALMVSSAFKEASSEQTTARYQLMAYQAKENFTSPHFHFALLGLAKKTPVTLGDMDTHISTVTGAEQLIHYDNVRILAIRALRTVKPELTDEISLLTTLLEKTIYDPITVRFFWKSPAFIQILKEEYPDKKTFRLLENYLLNPTENVLDRDILNIESHSPISSVDLNEYLAEMHQAVPFNFAAKIQIAKEIILNKVTSLAHHCQSSLFGMQGERV